MKEFNNLQDLIDICSKAKECNSDVALELTVPGQKETEIIIVKNSNIDYKLDYYCKNYNENLELNRCKDVKILRADIVMWDTMLSEYRIHFKMGKKEILEKLRTEDNELMNRLFRLEGFINSNQITSVSTNQANLLRAQFQIMRSYHEVLYARKDDLEREEEK